MFATLRFRHGAPVYMAMKGLDILNCCMRVITNLQDKRMRLTKEKTYVTALCAITQGNSQRQRSDCVIPNHHFADITVISKLCSRTQCGPGRDPSPLCILPLLIFLFFQHFIVVLLPYSVFLILIFSYFS